MGHHRRSASTVVAARPSRWRRATLGLATAVTMAGAGGVGYGLAAHAGPTPAVTDAAPTPVSTPAAAAPAAVTSIAPATPSPVLVDTAGHPVPAGLAASVRSVYTGLTDGDLDTVRQAYSHAGSDDWYTSRSHLESNSTRTQLLAALRTAPKHTSDGNYRYRTGNYTLTFGAADASGVGLVTITGPWSNTSNVSAGTSRASTAASSERGQTSSSTSRKSDATARNRSAPSSTCDPSGPPVFGDPANPNVITNRDCGYTDANGQARSRDRWIDDQLTSNG